MNVLLLQLDGSLPNLALMRLAGHHLALGDRVALRHAATPDAVQRRLGDSFDRVYASLIFEKTRPLAQRLLACHPDAVVGGTGWDLTTTLEGRGIDSPPDYSIYPDYRHSIGFTQRGCRLKCQFCVVPRKEGAVRQEMTAHEVWRGEPYPRHLVLLDNDFFGQPDWRARAVEIREGGFKVNFNQGINARFLDDEAAESLSSLAYFDADFKRRRLYTAWDNRKDEERLFAGLGRLVRYGVKPSAIMVYVLIGYWAGESEADWLYRVQRLQEFGCDPYPMPYVRNQLTVGFQRWVCGHYSKKVSWADFRAANYSPRKLDRARDRAPLPLFDGPA